MTPKNPQNRAISCRFLPFPLSRLPKPALRTLEPHGIPAKAETQDERRSSILLYLSLRLCALHNQVNPITGFSRNLCGDPLPKFMDWITVAKSVYSPKAVDWNWPGCLQKKYLQCPSRNI